MRRSMLMIVALTAVTASLVIATSLSAGIFNRAVLTTSLNGQEEVDASGTPGQGDLDARGVAVVEINTWTDEICWKILVKGIQLPAAAAHIHQAPAGVNGPIVVDFTAPTAGSSLLLQRLNIGFARGCVTSSFADAIGTNPSGFYVNVHNGEFPPGAVRGQL
jgi:hypothetical protein